VVEECEVGGVFDRGRGAPCVSSDMNRYSIFWPVTVILLLYYVYLAHFLHFTDSSWRGCFVALIFINAKSNSSIFQMAAMKM
jgi:hypothetical protein